MGFRGRLLLVVALAGGAVFGSSEVHAACTGAQLREADDLRKSIMASYHGKKWTEMDAQYRRLVATTCDLNDIDNNFGGYAARELGEIGLALERFKKIQNTQGGNDPYARLRPKFGMTTIDGPKPTRVTRTGGPSLDADGVAALRLASVRLEEKGGFDGYLPLGSYDIGDKHFTVKADGQVKASFNPKIGWSVTSP